MDILNAKFNFNSLSIKDLVEARDMFHAHLINKQNVVATAIGRYRIRKSDPWPNEKGYAKALSPLTKKEKRTLDNSEVREYSWPCILVFVEIWQERDELARSGSDDIVPRCIYMPDGRIVPICVVEAPRAYQTNDLVNESAIVFPQNYVGGGFPIIVQSQGIERIATIGCVVSDGNKYYALTNRHVSGGEGTEIFTKMKGSVIRIGRASGKQLGKIGFEEVYDGWKGKKIFINNDVGLIEIDDRSMWKTQILGIDETEKLADLNTENFSLSLISVRKPEMSACLPRVVAFGAVSGKMEGEVVGLFYRYKSLGGLEFVSDFLIGGASDKPLNTHFGDSGSLWLLEDTGSGKPKYYPLALHWGQHTFLEGAAKKAFSYALATNLTTACIRLDVDIVRGWNLDNEYSWGKTGHFKVAAKACELVSNEKLAKLLKANQKNIGYVDSDLLDGGVVSGAYKDSKNLFVPLADVADIIWRSTRPADESNHFADIDESDRRVANGKTLLQMCVQNASNIDIDKWIEYFEAFDDIKPNERGPREGALPFRVWQMYNAMIAALKQKDLAKFICAGGTMSHYVGDACQPLHISFMHHGRDESEKNVHTDYETTMVDKKMSELFNGVNEEANKIKNADLIGAAGKDAAECVIKLMNRVYKKLPPDKICDSFSENIGVRGKYDNMWDDLGKKTIDNMARGAEAMAILWQSAWKAGDGNAIAENKLVAIDQQKLRVLYNDKTFVPSYRMKDTRFKALLV